MTNTLHFLTPGERIRLADAIAEACRRAVAEDRSARCGGLKYKCGCAAVPSEKVKAFCPEHSETLE